MGLRKSSSRCLIPLASLPSRSSASLYHTYLMVYQLPVVYEEKLTHLYPQIQSNGWHVLKNSLLLMSRKSINIMRK